MATTPKRIEELASELAALTPEERTRVLAAVYRRRHSPGRDADGRSTWQRLHAMEGTISLGGDALEDCARLYSAYGQLVLSRKP